MVFGVKQVLERLEAQEAKSLQAVAFSAQGFGQRFLTQHAKSLYFSKAVEMYNMKFKAVQGFVSGLVEEDLAGINSVLAAMSRYSGG